MPTEIDSLQIKIESQSNDAAQSIDALAASLNNLKGASNMNKVSKNLNKLSTSLKSVEKGSASVQKLSVSLKSLKLKYATIAVAARKAFSAISSWVNQTNSYVENVNLFTVAMGEYADEAMEYAEAVNDALGIDISEFIRNQGIFMSMANGFGLAADQAYEMSKGLTELSYDLASFFNISLDAVGDGAFSKVQSGLAGELEPLRRLGFALSEASLQQVAYNRGINLSVREMTEAQKATLRYIAMVEQAANMGVVGDMSRTVMTSANAIRILKQQFAELTRSLGSLFIPIIMKVMPYLQAFVDILTEAIQGLATFLGFTMPKIDMSGVASGTEEIKEDLEESVESAKALMGFDELNVVNQDSEKGVATGNNYGSDLGLDVNSIWDASVLESVKTQVKEIKEKMEPVLELAVLIGGAFAAWKISKALFTGIDFVKAGLYAMSDATLMDDIALSSGKLAEALKWIKSTVGKTSIGGLIMGSGSTSVGAVAGAIAAVVAAVAALVIGIVDVYNKSENFRTGLSTIADGVKILIGKIGEFFGDLWESISGLIPQGVVDFIGELDLSIGDLLIAAGGLALFGPWGLAIEGAVLAIKGIGIAASDSLQPVELFGEGISEATTAKVEPFLAKMDELEQTFKTIDWGNIEISMTDVETISAQLGEIVTTITNELDADKNEALANIDPLKGAMDAESYAGLVAKVEESYELQKQKVQEGSDAINAIVAKAAAEGRTITDEEAAEIARIQEEMKTTGIKYLSESETESNLILTRLKDNATQLSAEQASEIIKKAIETRDETKAAAQEQYEGILLEAQRMLDTGVINKEEYDKIIEAAELTRKETTDKADAQYDAILKTAKTQMGEYAKYIDEETGEIKSNWKVFCEDLGSWWNGVWSNIKTWASDGWDAVVKWFDTSVKPWFTKEKWAEVFSGIKEGLLSTFTNAINSGIDKLNEFIGWINDKMSFTIPGFSIGGGSIDIPEWLGGGSFSIPSVGWSSKDVTLISIPKISKFADGGFIEDGLFTMNQGEIAGKFNNGKSVVANNEQIIAGISEGVYSAVVAAMGNGGSRESQNINVYLDGKQIYSSVKKTESERGKQIFGNQLGYGY